MVPNRSDMMLKTRVATTRIILGVVAAFLFVLPAHAHPDIPATPTIYSGAPASAPLPRRIELFDQTAPKTVRQMGDWVLDARDNGSLPFVIVDKRDAKVFAFDKNGRLLGAAWALVGLQQGDDSTPGIGAMPLKAIGPEMRTTPAGRFVARLGRDLGTDVLWVDYATAVSLHRVINTNLAEKRLERIASPEPSKHRISYGCINVPADFFDGVVKPAFQDAGGVVYILPEVKPMGAVFPAYYEFESHPAAQSAGAITATPAAYRPESGSVKNHDLAGIVH